MAKLFTAQGKGIGIDREKLRLNGVAVLTKGDANGDAVDDQTLDLLVQLGNASVVRARIDHPNRSDPGEIEQDLDRLVGQWTNFRRDGDVARADCQFLTKVPRVKAQAEELMAMAEEAPHLFGVSIVFDDTPHAKGQKPKRNPVARPWKLYATDFVDIPAANKAGLFSQTTQETDMDPLEMYMKDGKCYAKVGEQETEIKPPKGYAFKKDDDDSEDDDDSDTETEAKKKAKKKAQTKADVATIEQARAEAIEQERKYRKTFSTILSTAGITGKAAEDFEKFYGRSEEDLKFLAQHAIVNRAKSVGESGTGEADPPATEQQKKQKEVEAAQTKRFAQHADVRRSFGVGTDDAESAEFQAGLKRYLAACRNYDKKPEAVID